MQTRHFRRALAPLAVAAMLAACSRPADNPYSKLQNPPLVRASLHTVTLVSDDPGFNDQLQKDGYTLVPLVSNYPASIPVEAMLWEVPEQVAARPAQFTAPAGRGPDVRLLVMPPPARHAPVDPAAEQAFYRNVLGTGVPHWPPAGKLSDNVRVQVWTYFIDDVVAARKRLREAEIPVVFSPVGITTAYLGDHRTMGIRAPDGTVIELVQSAAQ
jgi:hypothetical protein